MTEPAAALPVANPLPVVDPPRRRLPEWLRVNLPAGRGQEVFNITQGAVAGNQLHTVCEEARCPNIHDCWARGTATFMVAGQSCTRGCRFCSVETLKAPPLPDFDEPKRLADAVERLKLDYVVITVVNRDDMPDGGAGHYRRCVEAVHRRLPQTGIELLSSDLAGNWDALLALVEGIPLSVFAHNVECVPRMDKVVRDPRASFTQSLEVLSRARALRPDIPTKSSLMVGVGETDDEVVDAMRQLQSAGVELLTLGQYLAPGRPGTRFLPVDRYVEPRQFLEYEMLAREMGFKGVASGPLVRSSYRAETLLEEARTGKRILPPAVQLHDVQLGS
ncbi:lipoyl synthase [Lacipirellula parvula]|uniref:Lipoyl synthase n=1 Tax=Lacipirellula parvula TaxID=2650471 RepID=A0A5K7X8Y3_9BACT|nr:lipoyl synthase [Lacipirellula parvula]BBO33120.1 lipoyl synthase [Lacipirellula parvula]